MQTKGNISEKISANTSTFEPRIVGFLCNWCSYSGADLAGVSRLKTAPNIRIIRTMCSGRVDPAFIIRAFELGADGVLISGCHFGDCHYLEGNFKTMRRVEMMKLILKNFGIDPKRLRLEWISASEAEKFARVSFEFTDEIRKLGPFKLNKN
ncbi:MAG TPA: hydrogenase iron-sulfur subunit [Ignavibacteria bacterium]|nr:hydrogenase iron-sulfur subunit [Ignavibacteria bacterium]